MPIEDADKVHSRGSKEEGKISILGFKVSFMKLMISIGVGLALIFLAIGGYMMMTAPPVVPIVVTPTPEPVIVNNDTLVNFTMVNTNYNYRVIQMTYSGKNTISNMASEILLSVYPPPSPHYVQRQAIQNDNVTSFDNENKTIYIYTGVDNAFHMSYNLPKYTECIDFINGNWNLNMDDKTHNLYKYKFNINSSKTHIIENGISINEIIKSTSDYSTIFIYSGTYKERILLTKSMRIIGVNNPIIDAGGSGADITITSNNNIISGLTLTNSGNKNFTDGGIVITSGSSGNIITKNDIYRTIYGILLDRSGSNTITGNTIRSNDKIGIMLIGSSLNTITKNNVYANIEGIHADASSNLNIIRENNLYNNRNYGIIIDNYANLANICEYNTYKNNAMSCSDSVDRDQNFTIQPITTSGTPNIVYTDEWWADCKGNPKCYQS